MQVGDIAITPVSDGTFVARPGYFGPGARPDGHDLFDRHGQAWLPIGCFVVRSGDRVVLVDAGMGPAEVGIEAAESRLVGGQLLVGLHALGIGRGDVTDVVCTHLHMDHVGWLFDHDARPVFPSATVWLGEGDWEHFVTSSAGTMAANLREGFRAHTGLRLLDRDTPVAPGVTAIRTPGHTPGHLCVVVASRGSRALLLGDAITCPVQLDEPTWHSIGDVDPALAERTRQRLWRELEGEDVQGAGAHFPELRFGRVLRGDGKRWWT